MSGRTHTPGPWFVMPSGLSVGDKKVWFDESGARCGETPNIIIECPTEADAHLFVAAPDMLVTLVYLDRWFDTDAEILDRMSEDARADHQLQHQMIREAIAKARGVV